MRVILNMSPLRSVPQIAHNHNYAHFEKQQQHRWIIMLIFKILSWG